MSNMSLGTTDLVDVDIEPQNWKSGSENTFFIWYEGRRYRWPQNDGGRSNVDDIIFFCNIYY